MKIPKDDFTIKVGPFIYDIIYSDDVSSEANAFGTTNNNMQKIYLQKTNIKKQKQEQAFLHEIIHACNFVNGLWYRLDKKESVSEEDISREISTTLYQVIKDNPKLWNNK